MIPRILHFIHLDDGAGLMSDGLATWVQHHPDWLLKVWGPDDLTLPYWRNGSRMRAIAPRDPMRAAAMLRWEILATEGGIVVDIDSACIRPLDESVLDCEAFACWEDEIREPGRLCAQIAGAAPRNPFIEKLVVRLGSQADLEDASVDVVAGSGFLTRQWRADRYAGLTVFPGRYFQRAPGTEAQMPADHVAFASRGQAGSFRRLAAIVGRRAPAAQGAGMAAEAPEPDRYEHELLVDVTELVRRDARTGIQRVTRSMCRCLLQSPPPGFRVRPVYAQAARPGYRYADMFALALRSGQDDVYDAEGLPRFVENDEAVDPRRGDIFLGLDLQARIVPEQSPALQQMRRAGVRVVFLVYDLLPVRFPRYFPPGEAQAHQAWLQAVSQCDGAICISRAVAGELAQWIEQHAPDRRGGLRIDWAHIGADIGNSCPTTGLPADAPRVLGALALRKSFLIVSTLEPRKGHAQALDAFERLWARGLDVQLIIVGKKGWLVDRLARRLREHPEAGRRLFWLDRASDEYLQKIYAAATCLLLPSEGEGFGLPLIEAAQHRLPILARDLPVFREIGGDGAAYFSGLQPQDLADAIEHWLACQAQGTAPSPQGITCLTWEQSTARMLECLLGSKVLH